MCCVVFCVRCLPKGSIRFSLPAALPGFTEEQVNEIKDIYDVIYFSGRNTTQALEHIEATFPETDIRNTIVGFIRKSPRGIIPKPRNNRECCFPPHTFRRLAIWP